MNYQKYDCVFVVCRVDHVVKNVSDQQFFSMSIAIIRFVFPNGTPLLSDRIFANGGFSVQKSTPEPEYEILKTLNLFRIAALVGLTHSWKTRAKMCTFTNYEFWL